VKLNNIFKRKELKQPEHESEKEKDMLVLKDSLSSEEKEEFRNQLISLMVPIIIWKEFPSSRNSERAISIIKGRHIIEDLKLKNSAQLDENYIKDIWDVCFKRAKELARAERGSKKAKYEKVNELTLEDIFEYDYSLSWDKNNDFFKTPLGKNISESIPSLSLAVFIAVALFSGLGSSELSIKLLALLWALPLSMILTVVILKVVPTRALTVCLAIGVAVLGVSLFSPQQPKPVTSTVPQSSTPIKPSPSPNPGFTEPLKNSQSIHQQEKR
jgi:Domain of unknown function DUF29